jgi:hypothetical protein
MTSKTIIKRNHTHTSWVFALLFVAVSISCSAQEGAYFTHGILANPDYHHGQLEPVVGVHNYQTLRANRERPDSADGSGWTYNHGPNMAYWNGKFHIQYISNPVGEHEAPGRVDYQFSDNGINWSKPVVLFPPYRIPDGTRKEGVEGVAKDLFSVTHQRMGFYTSQNGMLLTLGYYGICITGKDSPNDGNGIGRAVREIKPDGTFGPIYFIRYNKNWNEKNTTYPFYKSSKDKEFVTACDELLANPLMMMQWVEEADRDDVLIPLKLQFKAFSYYHLPDGKVVGFWKNARTAISTDGGKTWPRPEEAPGLITKSAKIWGQKTSDGKYATVYNPTQFRWPLAVSTSADGLEYTNLWLLNCEISTMRYGGQHKSYGPQYMRGILEGNGTPPDNNMWITYSINKEDIWVSKVPVPLTVKAAGNANDVFSKLHDGSELESWNIFSPLWAPVKIEKDQKGEKWLSIRDTDPYDYGVAERIFPVSKKIDVEFVIKTGQNSHGLLHIELQDAKGTPAARVILNEEGIMLAKDGYNFGNVGEYEADREYKIRIAADVATNIYEVFVNDERKIGRLLVASVPSFSRVVFRSGERRYYPNIESPGMQRFDVENGGIPVQQAAYFIKSLKTW